MLIYGTKATKLIVEPIVDICENCHTRHTMDMHVFQRYAHILFIPLFPTTKKGVSQCNHCRQVLRQKQMPESLKETYKKVEKHTHMPVWTWSGALLLLLLAIFSFSQMFDLIR